MAPWYGSYLSCIIYRLEAEKRQLVRLLMMKRKGRLDANPDSSKDKSANEQADIFSLLDNLTN